MEENKVFISREILRRLGVNFKPNRTKQNISCWNHQDKNPSLSVNLEKGIFYCFSCGDKGTLRNKYYETFHKDIYREYGLNNQQLDLLNQTIPEKKVDFSLPPEVDFIFDGRRFNVEITDAGKTWIKQRGFTNQILKDFRASYSKFGIFKKKSDPTNKDEWIYVINRILFPIFENGNIISYELRDIMGKTHYEKQLENKGLQKDAFPYKKLLYPKNSSINTLYNLDKLKKDEPLYIVEGLMDLISLRTHNFFQNSSCLFHVIPTERQYFLMEQFDKVILIPDNDLPGLTTLKKIKERLKNVEILKIPKQFKDINDITKANNKDERIKSIQDLINFNWLKTHLVPLSKFDIDANIKLLEANP